MSGLLVLIICVALLALIGLALLVYVSRPVRRLLAVTRSFAAGDYAVRAPAVDGPLGELSWEVNALGAGMQARLAAASQAESRVVAALNSSTDAVAALDREGRVLFANRALERLFGKDTDDIVANPFVWLLPDEQVMAAVHASRDNGSQQITLIERPGRQYLQIVTTPIAEGGEWAVLVVFHDITDVKRTELVRRDFVANVSHELRTPLAGIKALVETLAGGAASDPEVRDLFFKQADAEVDRLVVMVEELLELSRIESGELPLNLERIDVPSMLTGIVNRLRPLAERKRQTLSLDAPANVGAIEIDAARIERAVVNLVQNAIKFTPEGGSINVAAERVADAVIIRVHDTGPGIAEAELPRIFERFYKVDHSRASEGSGLGLALVRHAVEAHGGNVQAESRLGGGSTFTITLPLES